MSIYHFGQMKVISRGTGRSVIASSAYISGEKLYNEYDGLTHDYTRKQGVVFSEVMLPENAKDEWKNRQILCVLTGIITIMWSYGVNSGQE